MKQSLICGNQFRTLACGVISVICVLFFPTGVLRNLASQNEEILRWAQEERLLYLSAAI